MRSHLLLFLSLLSIIAARAPAGPWDAYNLAPQSRTIFPSSITRKTGTVAGAENALRGEKLTLAENSSVTFDFSKEVGGIISFHFEDVASDTLSLSYTESVQFIGPNSDSSKGGNGDDGAYFVTAKPKTFYTVPTDKQRGGFRWLTLTSHKGSVSLSNLTLFNTWSPHFEDLRAYGGFFHSDDELLNRIWYAGAYTVQLCSVPGKTGRAYPFPPEGQGSWANNGDLGTDGPVLVDAPKRDRTVWLGDLGISLHTAMYSTGDLLSSRNAIDSLFDRQGSNGMFGYCGPPWSLTGSDTYHLWSLVAMSTLYMYEGDKIWAEKRWDGFIKGMNYAISKVDDSQLFVVTNTADWLRPNTNGRHLGANVLFYRALNLGYNLASDLGHTTEAAAFKSRSLAVKKAINALLWDAKNGMYRDNDKSDTLPQDGNSLAIIYDAVATHAQAEAVSANLAKRWNKFGAVNVEYPGKISPFISGFEVMAHFAAGEGKRARDLIKLHWGYLLSAEFSTNSTFVEGLNDDGTPNYMPPNFLSQSHGWSTGPTPALSQWAMGIQLQSTLGQSWSWSPSSDLKTVQGGFSTKLGDFSATINRDDNGSIQATLMTPTNTTGLFSFVGTFSSVRIDGSEAKKAQKDGRTWVYGVPGGLRKVDAVKSQ